MTNGLGWISGNLRMCVALLGLITSAVHDIYHVEAIAGSKNTSGTTRCNHYITLENYL